MKLRYLYILGALFFLSSCEKFLEESPNKAGNNYITELDDLTNMTLNPNLQFSTYNAFFNDAMFACDDYGYGADGTTFYKYIQGSSSDIGAYYTWEPSFYRNISSGYSTWYGLTKYLYLYNTILYELENNITDGTQAERDVVKGRALFYRALIHYGLATVYAQHPALDGGNTPGIGYVSNPDIGAKPERGTSADTFAAIVADLEEAEKLFAGIGDKNFVYTEKIKVNFNAVRALQARVYLYLGEYTKADAAAKDVLDIYNYVEDLNDSKYDVSNNQILTNIPVYDDNTGDQVSELLFEVNKYLLDAVGTGGDIRPSENKEYIFSMYFSFDRRYAMSDELYSLYDAEDLRMSVYNKNNYNAKYLSPQLESVVNNLGQRLDTYLKFTTGGNSFYPLLNAGVSVPELYLIRAECAARGAGSADVLATLKSIRQNRFPSSYTDNIGSTLKDVLAERRREMPYTIRFSDVKRLNALDNANISVTRKIDLNGGNSPSSFTLGANAPFYALQLPEQEIAILGWEQNDASKTK